MTKAALGAVTYRVGERVALSEAPPAAIPPALRGKLAANGHASYVRSNDVLDLIGATIVETLELGKLDAAAIDRVVFTTESLAVGATKALLEESRAALQVRLHGLGLGRAAMTALTFMGCNGVIESLDLARLLVEADRADAVLVVAADAVADGNSRVLQPSVTVLGDGAASAVVRRSGEPGSVATFGEHWAGGFLDVATFRDRGSDFSATLVTMGKALARLRSLLPATAPDGILVCNNYGRSTLRVFTKMCGFPADNVFTGTLAAYGHVGNADVLVNIAELVRAKNSAPEVYALGTAHTGFSMLRLMSMGPPVGSEL